MRHPMGRVYLVASGKGGTGKTSVCAGVGAALAARGKRILLIDCDIGMRNLDLVLGLSDGTALDLYDVALRGTPLMDAVVSHPALPSLYLLSGPALWPEQHPDQAQTAALRAEITGAFDAVVVDAPAGLGTGFRLGCALCDEALLVTTPDLSAYRDAALTAGELRKRGLPCRLVINRVQPGAVRRGDAADLDTVMDRVGAGLLGVIPEDPRVRAAGHRGELQGKAGRASAAQAFVNIAGRLSGQQIPLMRLRRGGLL